MYSFHETSQHQSFTNTMFKLKWSYFATVSKGAFLDIFRSFRNQITLRKLFCLHSHTPKFFQVQIVNVGLLSTFYERNSCDIYEYSVIGMARYVPKKTRPNILKFCILFRL